MGQQTVRGLVAAAILVLAGGCAFKPMGGADIADAPVAERDLLAEAAEKVEVAQWPKPEPVPMMAWITGNRGDRVTKSDAADFYLASLSGDDRFPTLVSDATDKLRAAHALEEVALSTAQASRVSMNDIALVESAIQSLREHRDIYLGVAKQLRNEGEPAPDAVIADIRAAFADVISHLSKAADALADRLEHDRSSTYAQPNKSISNKLTDS
ncbi:MAG: hypothetical protein AAGD92_02975 [Pseudomonadota bacterium]